MTKVSATTQLPVPAQTVWAVIGNFGGVPDWHPLVDSSTTQKKGSDTTRTLELKGGGTIVEKLEHVDSNERLYTYSIQSSPLPVKNYTATLRVKAAQGGMGCEVEWGSEFEAEGDETEASKIISGVYEAGFENLKKMFGAK